MRLSTTIKKIDEAKTNLRSTYRVAKMYSRTAPKLYAEVNKALECLVQCPRWARTHVHGYERCLWDRLMEEDVVILYNVNGTLYKAHKQNGSKLVDALPMWDEELPRQMWMKLGECGGMYWKETLKPFDTKETKEGK